jgi:hypothetical protein
MTTLPLFMMPKYARGAAIFQHPQGGSHREVYPLTPSNDPSNKAGQQNAYDQIRGKIWPEVLPKVTGSNSHRGIHFLVKVCRNRHVMFLASQAVRCAETILGRFWPQESHRRLASKSVNSGEIEARYISDTLSTILSTPGKI